MTSHGDDVSVVGDAIPRTMVDAAVFQLHDKIISGAIPPGSHLRLRELAHDLDMSQMPVRQALSRLEQLGLIEVRPHRGAFVRELSAPDLNDTIETRLLLEVAAVERAAEQFTSGDMEIATALLDRFEAFHTLGMMVEARELHRAFHLSIYKASRSHWLVRAIEPVWRNCERYRFVGEGHEDDSPGLRVGHREILAACAAGDAQGAGHALRDHLAQSAQAMLANIPPASEE